MTTEVETPTRLVLRPGHEGANIRTWIGFKHFMYLAEESVITWFRDRGDGPDRLFHEHGVGLTVIDSSVQLPAVLQLDDLVTSEVSGGPEQFTVRLRAERPGLPGVLRGKLRVALLREADPPSEALSLEGFSPVGPLPAGLAPLAVAELAEIDLPGRCDLVVEPGADPAATVAGRAGQGAFVWAWRIPYYYCQFSSRIQHSGYVRAMEEVVDRFLADRGLSVGTLLQSRGWIPVVSRARVTVLADAVLEETMYTVLTVTDVLRKVSFDARMDCYVVRDGTLVHTATGRIMHAYAIARGPLAGRLAELDDATVAALTSGGRR